MAPLTRAARLHEPGQSLRIDTAERPVTSRLHFEGSNWFTTGEGQLMAEMASVGALDLSQLTPQAYPLVQVNDALEAIKARPAGFVSIVVNPDR